MKQCSVCGKQAVMREVKPQRDGTEAETGYYYCKGCVPKYYEFQEADRSIDAGEWSDTYRGNLEPVLPPKIRKTYLKRIERLETGYYRVTFEKRKRGETLKDVIYVQRLGRTWYGNHGKEFKSLKEAIEYNRVRLLKEWK